MKRQLSEKAKEAALCAIKVFNAPLIRFKSESYVVMMMIAWTCLLHAYYWSKGIDYCYCHLVNTRRRYERTKRGAKEHWDLERCLNDDVCPLDDAVKTNLRFLIGLRRGCQEIS